MSVTFAEVRKKRMRQTQRERERERKTQKEREVKSERGGREGHSDQEEIPPYADISRGQLQWSSEGQVAVIMNHSC